MALTSQERLALGVAVLLLVAGAAARALRTEPPVDLAGVEADASPARLMGAVEDSVERAERRRTPLAPGERLDPNTASTDELDRLPGVGPALAERIVAWRGTHGRFRTLADLDSVPGVGPAMLRESAPHLALRPAPSRASVYTTLASVADSPDTTRSARRESARAGRGPRWAPTPAGPVDLNSASAGELERLPGIGPALAERIVEHRARHGRFRSADGLADVPGVGPATVARLRPLVRATP